MYTINIYIDFDLEDANALFKLQFKNAVYLLIVGLSKMSRNNEARIYVGNLPSDIRERDLEDLFYKYGKILNISLKDNRRGPPFAFVEFEDRRLVRPHLYYCNIVAMRSTKEVNVYLRVLSCVGCISS